jgi:type II secretory pathway pseudopilin PulG
MLELLVGLLLLAVTVIVLFGMTTVVSGTGRQAEAKAVALSVARRQMEVLFATSQGNRKVATDKPFAIDQSLLGQFPDPTAVRGLYSVSPPAKKSNLQTLTVTVKWKNLAGGREPGGQSEAWSSVTLVRVASSAVDLSTSPYDGTRTESDAELFVETTDPDGEEGTEGSGDSGSVASGLSSPLQGIGAGSGGQGALVAVYGSKLR